LCQSEWRHRAADRNGTALVVDSARALTELIAGTSNKAASRLARRIDRVGRTV
jgi:hypothetical protein